MHNQINQITPTGSPDEPTAKPTAEQLLAEKAQLEKRLWAVNEQLARIDSDNRADALRRALKIMRDFNLSVADIRTNWRGGRFR